MCGRFALGVSGDDLRLGAAIRFPRVLDRQTGRGGAREMERRAQLGRDRRDRDKIRRERRRGNVADQQQDEEEASDEPEDSQDEEDGAASDVDPEDGMSQHERDRRRRERAESIPWDDEERWRPENFNVAPRSNCPIIVMRPTAARLRGGGNGGDGQEKPSVEVKDGFDLGDQALSIETMQWGLIPHWSKHPPSAPLNTINARSENLLDNAGGMWQSLKGPKRCVVMVQGYYEWQKKGATKIPHFTKLPQTEDKTPSLMMLAGLYDTVKYVDSPPDEPPLKTFTILTTTPSKSLEFLHDRMPCILESEDELVAWLDCREGWTSKAANLLRPYEGAVECYPVPKEVGKVGTNSSTYVEPVSERKDGIASFFKRQEEKGQGSTNKTAVKPKVAPTAASKPKVETPSAKKEEPVHSPIKTDSKDVKGVEGLGDDSNAPQSQSSAAKGKGKRKVQEEPKQEDVDSPKRQSKRIKLANRNKEPVKVESESDDDIEIVDNAEAKKLKNDIVDDAEAKKPKNDKRPSKVKGEAKDESDEQQTSLDSFLEK